MRGFTLIELLISIAITIVLAAVAAPIYGNLQVSSQMNESVVLMIQTARTARERSLSRVNNVAHGIKLQSDSYVLYQGSSYDERTQSYDRVIDLEEAVGLSWDLVGVADEINFSKSLGVPNATGTITFTHSTGSAQDIMVNDFGMVEWE